MECLPSCETPRRGGAVAGLCLVATCHWRAAVCSGSAPDSSGCVMILRESAATSAGHGVSHVSMGEATRCVDRGEELLVDQEWQVELTEYRTYMLCVTSTRVGYVHVMCSLDEGGSRTCDV